MIRTTNVQRRLTSSLLSFMLFTLAGIAAAQTPANSESLVEPAVTNEAQGQDVATTPNTADTNEGYLAPPPLLTQTSEAPSDFIYADFTDEARRLRLKSRRQMGGAIGNYAVGASLMALSAKIYFTPCDTDPGTWIDLCESLRVPSGIIATAFGSLPILAAGLPLHRASNRNRRTARALEAGELPDFSRQSYRGRAMQHSGKIGFYVSGGLLLTSIGAGIAMIPLDPASTGSERAAVTAMDTALVAAGAGVVSSSLFFRGRNLQRRDTRLPPVQAAVTPVFYGDGFGARLYMGF